MYRKKHDLLREWAHIEASAPARIVLIGDYGDMEERNAIAISVDQRLKVIIRPHQDEGKLRLNLKNLNDVREWSTDLPLFTMTKMVAHQSDVLVLTKFMASRLKPLVNPKYRIFKTDSQQQTDASQTISDNKAQLDSTQTIAPTVNKYPPLIGESHHSNKVYDDNLLLHGEPKENRPTISATDHADMAVIAFFILYMSLGDSYAKSIRPSLDIEIESEIPMCQGMGSSTAYGVALCIALMKVYLIAAEPALITDWSVNIDRFFHSEASTLHSSVVVEGGYIYYQYGKLRSNGVPHTSPVKLMLIDTGIRRDPQYVNKKIKTKLREGHEAINALIGGTLNDLASTIWRRINDSRFEPSTINESLNMAQGTLLQLGLSDRKIHDIWNLANQHGLVCKQSQAGETLFLLYDEIRPDLKTFRRRVANMGYKFEDHDISFAGVQLSVTKRSQEELDRLYEELNLQFIRENPELEDKLIVLS